MTQFNSFQKLTQLLFVFLFVFSVSLFSQDGDATNGKKLFKANCIACHKLDKKVLGPPLKGITLKRDRKWLHAWIKDNITLQKTDKLAKQVFEEGNKLPMQPFPQLSEKDIEDILAYTDDKPKEKKEVTKKQTTETQTVDPIVAKGKKIFKANCIACHKLNKKVLGPALFGITDKRDRDWLHKWIKDNNALRKSGDALAKQVFEEHNKMPMNAFPQLSEEDIDAMLAYFKVGDVKKTIVGTKSTEEVKEEGSSVWITWLVAIVVIALLVYMLLVSKNGFLKIMAIIALILIITYFLFNWLMSIGIDQNYQPIQPIAFSHKIHAGDNKIDCQYCHSSAKHSKTSGVPTANVCMNCHKSISEVAEDTKVGDLGKKELDQEIQKIYDAVGWDSENFKYIENYEVKAIQWVRVHNLPDFAYYNHSQHVTVAGISCQKCHGPVEEMDEMYQFSPLTMAWCIDCHKDTEVNKDNKFYTKIHEELSKKYNLEKVTIADLGGKECAKCHY
ncbi:MAG: c-type cytochrome [Flavobacteriaceae bacterium]|nr:c-type cytochrome [Flavobacteriaceae bacterium]